MFLRALVPRVLGLRRPTNVRAKEGFNRGGLQAAICATEDSQVSHKLGLPNPVTEFQTRKHLEGAAA